MQFFINKIRVEKKTGNIVAVVAFKKGESKKYWVATGFIAQLADAGVTFNTFYEKGTSWVAGAKVESYDGTFLKTVPNGTERDNLESLPTEYI